MKVTAETIPYAVLGHPIRHSFSPGMHNAAFAALGMKAVYLALDVLPDDLEQVLPALGSAGFGGLNVTIPLKERALGCMDELDASAQRAGAVNTVAFRDGKRIGYNTDGDGLLDAVREAFPGVVLPGATVMILGAGGAARAAAVTLLHAGVSELVIVNRTEARAQAVAAEVMDAGNATVRAVRLEEAAVYCREHVNLLIQSTPIGMREEDEAILPATAFRSGQAVYDMVYTHPETCTMRTAREAGAHAVNGLGMLLHQGVRAFKVWTGVNPPIDVMRKELKRAVYGDDDI